MKFQKLFVAFFAAAALFVGCKEEEDTSLPVLNVAQSELAFEQGGGTATLTVTSNRPWTISSDENWLAFSPSSGVASDQAVTVTVTALANSASDRTGSFKVKTDFDYRTVTVTQPGEKGEDPTQTATGSGTATDPYNVIAAIQEASKLSWSSNDNYESTDVVYVTGKISRITEGGTYTEGGSYGNATFYISADGTTNNEFYVYRALYLGNKKFSSGQTDIKVGDEVIICGKLMNYKGNTPETVSGSAYLYSLNGEISGGGGEEETGTPSGTGTQADPLNVAAALNLAKQTGETNSDYVYVKGTIATISEISTSYGNATYTIKDADVNNSFTVYRGYYLGNTKFSSEDQIKVGDEVVVYGQVVNFKGNTPELTQGNYIYSLNGQTAGGGDEEDYSNAEAKTVAEFISAADTDTYYKLTGTVSSFNSTYCSFDLTDETGTIYVYSVDNKASWSSKIKNGGTVTLAGKYLYYESKSQHEVVNAQILSFEAGQGGGETEETKTVTVAEFIAAEVSQTQPYQLTGTIGGSINTTYGNFDLTDETGTVYVYGLTATNLGYGAKNDQSYSSLGVKEGDTVTIIGFRGSYNGKDEVVYPYYVSHTSGGGEQGGGEETGSSVSFETNKSAQSWASDSDATYGSGYSSTTQGVKVGYYQNSSNTKPADASVATDHIRVYKNYALVVTAPDGKKISKIVLKCTKNSGSTSYCSDMTPAIGGGSAKADSNALTITWTPSEAASKLAAIASTTQVRIVSVDITYAE